MMVRRRKERRRWWSKNKATKYNVLNKRKGSWWERSMFKQPSMHVLVLDRKEKRELKSELKSRAVNKIYDMEYRD